MSSYGTNSAPDLAGKSLPLFGKVETTTPSTSRDSGLNDDLLVRTVITTAIKFSGKSRDQIADEMTEMLGTRVTERMLTSFTSESKEFHRWPAAWDRAFCAAVGDDRLLRCRIEKAGYQVIGDREQSLLELGRQYLIQKRATEEIQLLEKRLAGVEL